MQINFGHIRYFVVVAEELHFGRAAARLHIAQPPLSQQIARLEQELGIKLFARKSRSVELTSAGQVFLTKARRMLLDFDESVLEAQRAYRGEAGRLVVGTIPIAFNRFYPVILPQFKARHPDVTLIVRSMSTTAQIQALHTGQIDIAVLRLPVQGTMLDVKAVFREPLVVALPSGHPLAKARTISLEMIAKEPQVMFPRPFAPDYYDYIVELFKGLGPGLVVSQEADHVEAHLGLVGGEFGVSLMPETVSRLRFKGVVYRPLRDRRVFTECGIIVLRGRETGVIREFLRIANSTGRVR